MNDVKKLLFIFLYLLQITIIFVIDPDASYAKKTNQVVYEEPFDEAAGGAFLTRASREGVLFANPALMPYGEKFFRWLGTQFALLTNKESVDLAKGLINGTSSSDSSDSSALVKQVFSTPIHFGAISTISFLSNNFGLGIFTRFEPDIRGQIYNDVGVPEIKASAEAYAGAVVSYAVRTVRWFAVGITAKYLYVAEPDISISLSNVSQLQKMESDPSALQKIANYGAGTGVDIGTLFFWQGYNVDYRLAITANDIGNTSFASNGLAFKQTVNAGLGLTLHNGIDAIHLGLDYRDILGAYEETIYKRIYTGAKLIIRNHLGFAVGAYQGFPTYGVRLNLYLIKLGATVYAREMGSYLGDDQRNLYVMYFSFGF